MFFSILAFYSDFVTGGWFWGAGRMLLSLVGLAVANPSFKPHLFFEVLSSYNTEILRLSGPSITFFSVILPLERLQIR